MMCVIILDKYTDNLRNFTQPRDTPVVAYKVFRKSSGSLRSVYNSFQFNTITVNKDSDASMVLYPKVKEGLLSNTNIYVEGMSSARSVEFPAGFFSFKTLPDALQYCRGLRPYYVAVVRKVLLLDVIGEYQSTAGQIYLSKILYVVSKEDEQLYPMPQKGSAE